MPLLSPWLLVPLAAGPGVFAWFSGRALVGHLGDPLFAERMWLHRRQVTGAAFGVSTLIGMSLGFAHAQTGVWLASVAVLIGSLLLASFHTRKQIFEETWSFATFARFQLQLILGFAGFWLAVAAAPLLVIGSGAAAPLASVIVIVTLVLWGTYYSRVTPWLFGGTPVTNVDLQADLSRLLAKTTLAAPVVYEAGPRGGVFANALALPSLNRSGVIVFRTLLERFSRPEIAAILAHELAHLEQFNKQVLKRHRAVTLTLIALGAGVVPYFFARIDSRIGALGWMVFVVAAIAYLGRGHQQRETAGDARAAELVGDPEILIAALERLHTIGRVPRRLDTASEARATHPGLARRVQALRKMRTADAAPVAPVGAVAIPTRQAGGFLVFETDRLRYLREVPDGDATDVAALLHRAGRSESYLYQQLASVHIVPVAGGADVVVQSGSKTLARIPIASEHVQQTQSRLDSVDLHFQATPAVAGHKRSTASIAVLLALLGFFVAGPSLLVQAIAAVIGSSPRAAMALAAGSGAVVLFVASGTGGDPVVLGAIAVLSALLFWTARRWRRSTAEDGSRTRFEFWTLALWTIWSIAVLGVMGLDAVRISQVAAASPAAIVAPISLAAWLWFAPVRLPWRSQLAVLMLLLVAISVAIAGTTWFVDRVSRDPLLLTRAGVEGRAFTSSATAVDEAFGPIVLDRAGDLRLSSDGRAFAAIEWCESYDVSDRCRRRTVAVGDASGVRRKFEAAEVQFAGDNRLLVLKQTKTDATLHTEDLAGAPSGWSVTLPSATVDTVIVDRVSSSWIAIAEGRDSDARTAFVGSIGETGVAKHEWSDSADTAAWVEWLLDSRLNAYGIATSYGYDSSSPLELYGHLLLPYSARRQTTLLRANGESAAAIATSTLEVRCFHSAANQIGIVCFADDGRRTHVWRILPDEPELQAIGWIDRTLWERSPPDGDRWIATSGQCGWQIVDVASRTASRLLFSSIDCPVNVVLAGTRIAALSRTADEGAELRVYDLVALPHASPRH